jgi:nickel/cobalt transporter (NicO) family protein
VAFGLGAAHAIQPGHGKTLVAATVLGERGSWLHGATLAVVTTLTHTAIVLLVAGGLWWTGSTQYGAIHASLARVAGFAIAALGLWRLGRHLAGFGEHDEEVGSRALPLSRRERGTGGWVRGAGPETETDLARPPRSIIGLGVAGGLVPCWDAIGLIVLANAVGRLALGVLLLLAFSLGMAVVLIAVGWAATRLRRLVEARDRNASWERALGSLSGLLLAAIGLFILAS